jgi:hypothetical protein
MEYWTGVELSDNFTQVYQKSYHIHIYSDMINNTIYFLTFQADIKNFRPKLAAILLSSDLNKRKGCPLYKNKTNKSTEDNETDSSGVEILEPSLNPNKRKRSPPISPEDDPISLYFEEICAKEKNHDNSRCHNFRVSSSYFIYLYIFNNHVMCIAQI